MLIPKLKKLLKENSVFINYNSEEHNNIRIQNLNNLIND